MTADRLYALVKAEATDQLWTLEPPPTNDEYDLIAALRDMIDARIAEKTRNHDDD